MDFSSLNPVTSNALNLAARTNDFQTVRRLLKKMNPNCIDNRGWTCLHEAAANDSYESLMLILKHSDCRPLAETHEGHTALYLACRHQSSVQTITVLLESEDDIANYGSTECVTPLHIASAQGRIEVIQLLIEYGAIVNVQDFDGDTPLHDAALARQRAAVTVLLHAGAEPEIQNETAYTPFHLACFKGCYLTIKTLYPFINDINQITVNGDSPLILATQGCNDEIMYFLLDHGADPHLKNKDGDMAIDLALNMGYSEIFKILLDVTDTEQMNPDIILNACKPHYFKLEILEALLNHDLGPEFFDFYELFYINLEQIGDIRPVYLSNAPLNSFLNICEYIYNRSPESFREFLYSFLIRGVSVDPLDVSECPPLVYIHYCAHSACFYQVFKILMEHGCNVDYCSFAETRVLSSWCIPDAFIASLSSDPTTAPFMMPYSLLCEPQALLQFAFDNGVLGRIPMSVQRQLLIMLDSNYEGIPIETLSYQVLSLKHLCRLKIRDALRKKGTKSTNSFLSTLKQLRLPKLLTNYLRYNILHC